MNNCLNFTLDEKVEGPLRPLKGYMITLTEAKNYTLYSGITIKPGISRRIYGDALFYTDDTFSTIDGDGKTQAITKSGYYYVKVNKAPCQIVIQDNYLTMRTECLDTRLSKYRNTTALVYYDGIEPLHVDSSDLRGISSIKEVYTDMLSVAGKVIRFDIRDFGKCVELFAFRVPTGAYGEIEELLQAMYDNGRRSGTLAIGGLNVSARRTNITYQGTRITAAMKFQFSDSGWSIL